MGVPEKKSRQEGRRHKAIKNEGVKEENPEKILQIYKDFYKKLLTGKEMTTREGKEIEEMVNKYIEVLERKALRQGIEPFTEEEYEKVKKELKNYS